MKDYWPLIFAVVAIVVIVVFGGFATAHFIGQQTACDAANGVLLKTADGYRCVVGLKNVGGN